MKPVNFLEENKEKNIKLINFNKYHKFGLVFLILIILIFVDYRSIKNQINLIEEEVDENNILLDEEKLSKEKFSSQEIDVYKNYTNLSLEKEDIAIDLLNFIKDNSNENIFINEFYYTSSELEIIGLSTREDYIYKWVDQLDKISIKEIRYENDKYMFILWGDLDEI